MDSRLRGNDSGWSDSRGRDNDLKMIKLIAILYKCLYYIHTINRNEEIIMLKIKQLLDEASTANQNPNISQNETKPEPTKAPPKSLPAPRRFTWSNAHLTMCGSEQLDQNDLEIRQNAARRLHLEDLGLLPKLKSTYKFGPAKSN